MEGEGRAANADTRDAFEFIGEGPNGFIRKLKQYRPTYVKGAGNLSAKKHRLISQYYEY